MTSSTAAAPVRLVATVLAVASLAALVVVGRTEGATTGRSWSAYLAPAAACPGSTDPRATPVVQGRAVGCLLNWARTQAQRGRLTARPALRRAAALKGRRVASCAEVSHTPCGTDVTAAIRAAGYRFSAFGENLFVGPWGGVSARDVVAAWLRSPAHRAIVLERSFRDVGAAPARARGLLEPGDAVVWTATFASPR